MLLLKRGLSTHAGKLALTSKSLMIEVGKRELNGMHPAQFMETVLTGEGGRAPFQVLCTRMAIVYGENVMPPPSYNSVLTVQNIRHFNQIYQHSLKSRLAMARDENPDSRFTFHLVTRFVAQNEDFPSKKMKGAAQKYYEQKADKHGGEVAIHRFICMPQAVSALLFMQRWSQAQKYSCDKEASCMMECGPSKETQTRKWIIDLDGKVEDLHTFGLLPAGELCAEEVSWLHDTPTHSIIKALLAGQATIASTGRGFWKCHQPSIEPIVWVFASALLFCHQIQAQEGTERGLLRQTFMAHHIACHSNL